MSASAACAGSSDDSTRDGPGELRVALPKGTGDVTGGATALDLRLDDLVTAGALAVAVPNKQASKQSI